MMGQLGCALGLSMTGMSRVDGRSGRGRRETLAQTKPNWICLLLVLCYGVHQVGSDCTPASLMDATEGCIRPLSEPTAAALHGALAKESWRPTCTIYNQSRDCLERLMRDCPATDIEVRESVTQALKTSMGQLCESKQTFQRYLLFAECYARQKNTSERCMNHFREQVEQVIEEVFDEELSNQELCRIHLELVRCINKPIQSQCGVDAARLIYGIAKAQVPMQISRHCEFDEPPWAAPSHVHGHQASALLITWLTAWTTIRVVCNLS